MKKVAILGASGQVGSVVTERLLEAGEFEVVPCIHSSGNAMGLARRALDLKKVNVLVAEEIAEALAGCTHVVNCSRGNDEVMIKGLANLLEVSKSAGVERFIHLSSVAVYGDPPPPESVHESAATKPEKGTYGWVKLRQDQMVATACSKGLPCVILCPPNISGLQSPFLYWVLNAMRNDRFVFVDDGHSPCNLVDVDNLAYAIQLALTSGRADARRIFVTDKEDITWKMVIDALLPLLDNPVAVPTMSRAALIQAMQGMEQKISIRKSLKRLVSGEVRAALRKDPLWANIERAMNKGIKKVGMQERLRNLIAGSVAVPGTNGDGKPHYDVSLAAMQLRGVQHSCDKAAQELGYQPVLSFEASMKRYRDWYRQMHGMDTEAWELFKHLY